MFTGKFSGSLDKIISILCFMCRSYIIICRESNLRSFGICRENNLRTFGTNVANKFTHFVWKVFARKILPTGKLGLFRPLGGGGVLEA